MRKPNPDVNQRLSHETRNIHSAICGYYRQAFPILMLLFNFIDCRFEELEGRTMGSKHDPCYIINTDNMLFAPKTLFLLLRKRNKVPVLCELKVTALDFRTPVTILLYKESSLKPLNSAIDVKLRLRIYLMINYAVLALQIHWNSSV
jgi:hypothetical protein